MPFVKGRVSHRLLREPYENLLSEVQNLKLDVVQDTFRWSSDGDWTQFRADGRAQSMYTTVYVHAQSLEVEDVSAVLQSHNEWEDGASKQCELLQLCITYLSWSLVVRIHSLLTQRRNSVMNRSKTEHSLSSLVLCEESETLQEGASVRGSGSCEVFKTLGKACSQQWDSLQSFKRPIYQVKTSPICCSPVTSSRCPEGCS